MAKILILDEYPAIQNLLVGGLAGGGNVVVSTEKPESILEVIVRFDPGVAIPDLFGRGKYSGSSLEPGKNQSPEKSLELNETKEGISAILRRPDPTARV